MGEDNFYVKEFIQNISTQKKLSTHTCIAYETDLKEFCVYLLDNFKVEKVVNVNHRIIRHWISSLLDSGLKARSVNRKISTLKSYYKYLMRIEIVSINPMAKILNPKTEKRLPEFNTENEIEKLFQLEFNLSDLIECRNKLILLLLYSTGMRRSELANITFNDVDTFNMNIKVLGKGNKVRMVPILKEWIELYNYYLRIFSVQLNPTFIFCDKKRCQISIPTIYNMVKKYLSLVTTKHKKSPHVLRHSFATHMLNNGADLNSIKELLGHSNLAATQVYTHNTIDKLKKSFQQAHPRSGK